MFAGFKKSSNFAIAFGKVTENKYGDYSSVG